MTSNEIRKRFLDFFAARGHRVVRSSSLVPANDPTLLFANAGMNQFKDVFLGAEKRDYARACSSQKCVRAGGKHNDLEQVGRTTRHHTFFEMLGNFSFGDYFKKDAVAWAWELVTKEFAIPKDKLYATIFEGATGIPRDAEAHEYWRAVDVPADRIFEMGMKDNFWQMGETGPCGPCSEIHYDMGPAASDHGHPDCKFPCDCGRYVELWNLVFMQFNRDETGKMTPLPRPSIDTGAGLERMATVLQGKLSNFDTDLFRPLIEEAAELANVEPPFRAADAGLKPGATGTKHENDVSLRIIADHARAATFLISDGVLPSNEGRGYVLRLIMRRALYHGQTLGLNEPFLFKMSGHVADMMKVAYPELVEASHRISKEIKIEEEQYAHTTKVGVERLLDFVPEGTQLPIREWQHEFQKNVHGAISAGSVFGPPDIAPRVRPVLRGEDLFRLHDTFGLRPEFVKDILKTIEIDVDRAGYEDEMQKQRERARASWKGAGKKAPSPIYQQLAEKFKTEFVGYTQTNSAHCKIIAIVRSGQTVNEAGARDEVEIFLDHTPFYAEAGGQVGDIGHFYASPTEIVGRVNDTFSPVTGLTAHKVTTGERLTVGDLVTAHVNGERRDAIRRNHTATHVLHAVLRYLLGTHVKQAGSLVAPDHLRFDFTHYEGITRPYLLDIEELVNVHVLRNEEVRADIMELEAAVNSGAMALFGEKYGDRVRVVAIGDGSFSKELCGGTHVSRTGDIGLFRFISERSVGAGIRRVEALTGTGALEYLRKADETLTSLSESLRAKPEELLQAVEKLKDSETKLRKQLKGLEVRVASSAAEHWKGDVRIAMGIEVKGVRVVPQRVEASDRTVMRQMVDNLRTKIGSGVIVLGSAADGKVSLIVAVTKDLTDRLDAGRIIKEAVAMVGGKGGGRKDLAEAGGTQPEKLDEALQAVPSIIEKML